MAVLTLPKLVKYGAVTVCFSQFLIQADEPMHPQCLRLLLQGGKLGLRAPEGEPGGLILGFHCHSECPGLLCRCASLSGNPGWKAAYEQLAVRNRG